MGDTNVYAIMLDWPNSGQLVLGLPQPTSSTNVSMLGYGPVDYSKNTEGRMVITMPIIPFNKMPCDYAWVFKMENLANA
jgi:alpha-L-fucosidase